MRAFVNTEKHSEALELFDRIKYYEKIVERVSAKPAHIKIIRNIIGEASKLVGRV